MIILMILIRDSNHSSLIGKIKTSGEVNCRDARKSAIALKTIKGFFEKPELVKLVTSLLFSKLYYGSQVWLIPKLLELYFKNLYFQSGKVLQIIHVNLSYRELHKIFSRATPNIFLFCQTAESYYETLM